MKKKNYPLFCVVVMIAIIAVVCVIIAGKLLISSEKQEESEGSVTIHTTSGEVLGYYGDGANGQVDIELYDSWLVGSDKEKTSSDPEPLVIDIPEPTQKGKVTVYDKDKEIVYNYQGDFIKIVNDGKDGEPIEIEINIPYDKDSCFQEGETDGQ